MSDPEPFRVICLVAAERCAILRASLVQPSGVADRRAIAAKLQQNLLTKAPLCRKQGSISIDAEAYLIGWVSGTWPKIPRPASYRFLRLRRTEIANVHVGPACAWEPPPRFRVYTLLRTDAESDDNEDDDSLPLDLVAP